MSFKLSEASVVRAIKHLCKYGDTDVFPHLPELAFFHDQSDLVVSELKDLDLDSYHPGGAVEALAPKSRFGFRITHQLSAVDSILFLAAVIEIGHLIEAKRLDVSGFEAFSYRFDETGDGSLFRSSRTFKDWLHAQRGYVQGNLKIKQVVATDISDFYARINFHRLENLLDEAAPGNGAARYIKKVIKVIRGKQSFGLPVGGAAARLLAELALSDTDKALSDNGIVFTRFVDDFRIFLNSGENPYDALSYLAQQLGINEGLSLNAGKTRVMARAAYLDALKGLTSDISEEAEGDALEALTSSIYFDEVPDPADIEALKTLNLLGLLQEEVGKENYDSGLIKVIFRALRIAKPLNAIEYLRENFTELVVFSKEVSQLMQALESESPGCFDDLSDILISTILNPPAASVQVIRTWLLELLVRGTVNVSALQFKKLEVLSSILDKRQLQIIRGRIDNKNYFRMNKSAFGQIPPFEQPMFICGAACLPKDEYENWLSTLKPMFSGPTGNLFLNWVKLNQVKVLSKLNSTVEDQIE